VIEKQCLDGNLQSADKKIMAANMGQFMRNHSVELLGCEP